MNLRKNMKKYLAVSLILGVMLMTVGLVVAYNQANQRVMNLPANAIEVAPGVFYLGRAIDNGRIVEGYAFVDYKKGHGKPTGCKDDGKCQGWEDPSCADCVGGGNGDGETDTSSCYGFLAKGAKWKTIEPYLVDPDNNAGLNKAFVKSNLASDIAKWETAADGNNILGDEIAGSVDRANIGDLNGANEVMFANINSPGAIGVTIVWGYFGGPPFARELVEWDMIFDDTDFSWSESGEAGKMDFENIATHELGHSVGLDDLYDNKCSEMTMYGYASNGETDKRTLEDGDIAGIRKLY
jgi:hypothetical protein